jgi:ribosome maturation factor RimP
MSEIPPKVEEGIEKIVAGEGLELVHLDYKRQGRSFVLRIDIDKEGGVTLDDCQSISHQVSTFLDVEDFIPGEYDLQVSSPGLDRKFYKESDYQKFIGRLVRVKTGVAVKGLHVVVGRLTEYSNGTIVVIDEKSGKDYPIELKDVKETRLEVEI